MRNIYIYKLGPGIWRSEHPLLTYHTRRKSFLGLKFDHFVHKYFKLGVLMQKLEKQ